MIFKRLNESIADAPLVPMSERARRAIIDVCATVLILAATLLGFGAFAAFLDGEVLVGIGAALASVGVFAIVLDGARVEEPDRGYFYAILGFLSLSSVISSTLGSPDAGAILAGLTLLVTPAFNIRSRLRSARASNGGHDRGDRGQ